MEKYFKLVCLFSCFLVLFGACKPIPSVPTATITADVLNNVVTFKLATTNSTAYKWRFGDGDSVIVYTSTPVIHTYPKDGTIYSVTLFILGPGGSATATTTVNIPVMTPMDLLTGGSAFPKGKAWIISSSAGIYRANPDSSLMIERSYPAALLTTIGLGEAYTDKFIFFSNGNYVISPQGGGALAGLSYCTVNNIVNVQPQGADSLGLTYITPYKPSTALTFAFNPGKTLTIATTADGVSSTNESFSNVNTLSFSPDGFIGIRDFMSECIVQELTPSHLTVALFLSNVAPQAPLVGQITKVLILTFKVAS